MNMNFKALNWFISVQVIFYTAILSSKYICSSLCSAERSENISQEARFLYQMLPILSSNFSQSILENAVTCGLDYSNDDRNHLKKVFGIEGQPPLNDAFRETMLHRSKNKNKCNANIFKTSTPQKLLDEYEESNDLINTMGVSSSSIKLNRRRKRSLPFLRQQEIFRSTPGLVKAHGYPCEVHTTMTRDGYILQLHRIPGSRSTNIGGIGNSSKFRRKNKINTFKKEILSLETIRDIVSRITVAQPSSRALFERFLEFLNETGSSHREDRQQHQLTMVLKQLSRELQNSMRSKQIGVDALGTGTNNLRNLLKRLKQKLQGARKTGTTGKPVVLLYHGLSSSSIRFVANDPRNAIAYMLADAGYDVWLGNYRGNTYSRGHLYLDSNKPEYWKFCLDDIFEEDIPAVFRYILATTGQQSLSYIGHSLGITALFAATSSHPYLIDQVKVAFALAPASFMDHPNVVTEQNFKLLRTIWTKLEATGLTMILTSSDTRRWIVDNICLRKTTWRQLCVQKLLLENEMNDIRRSFNPNYEAVLLSSFSESTTSIRVMAQFAQWIGAGGMQKFDYGPIGNLVRYSQPSPPKYSFSQVTFPVAVFWGLADNVTSYKDVAQNVQHLPNVILNRMIPDPDFNHEDLLISESARRHVFLPIMRILAKYN